MTAKKTLTEAELKQLISEGKTHREIANMIGRFYGNVAAACSVLGIKGPNSKFRGDSGRGQHDLQAYLRDMRTGMTVAEIAKKHGRSPGTVTVALKRAKLPTCARLLLKAEAEQKAA